MGFLLEYVVWPILRYAWDLLTMPRRLREILFNHLHEFRLWQGRVDRRLDALREDVCEQKGICQATRDAGACPPEPP